MKNNKENALDNYLKFLTTGGSMYPVDELKVAGVDLTKEETFDEAFKEFEKELDKLEELV